jgi:hypothetical protein
VNSENEFYWPWEIGQFVARARVMVYGYNADLETGFEQNLMRIRDFARIFLRDLWDMRDDVEVPTIFC